MKTDEKRGELKDFKGFSMRLTAFEGSFRMWFTLGCTILGVSTAFVQRSRDAPGDRDPYTRSSPARNLMLPSENECRSCKIHAKSMKIHENPWFLVRFCTVTRPIYEGEFIFRPSSAAPRCEVFTFCFEDAVAKIPERMSEKVFCFVKSAVEVSSFGSSYVC